MILGQERINLTKESILQRCSEKQIYEYYWGSFKVGNIYSSPLRKDPAPSFGIYTTKNNHLRHHDFGDEKNSGNCFSFVSQIKGGLGLNDVLELIEKDLGLIQVSSIKNTANIQYIKRKTEISITAKKFTQEELRYWNQYAQDISDLKKNDVYSVDKLWINGYKQDTKGDLCFAYLFIDEDGKEYLKIYRPYAKDRADKWKNSCPNTLISGWDRIKNGGKRVIIVGSKKDEICIRKLTEDCCSTQNESKTALTEEKIKFFQDNWERSIIGWDPDPPGIEACTYYNKTHGFEYVNVPNKLYLSGTKDWSDVVSDYGIGTLQTYLKNRGVL